MNPSDIQNLIQTQKETFIAHFKEMVECPSVSNSTAHKPFIRKTAQIAKKVLEFYGATAEIIETKGNPVVLGRLQTSPTAPWVGIYNHIDVQPAEKGQNGWTMDPFVFTEKNGRYYSRGTTDDKGPALTALWAASMLQKFNIHLNVEFIWELEEEIGSPNFEEFVLKVKDKIHSKVIVISDTIWISNEKPATSAGLRGLLGMLWTLQTGKKDVHSGLCGGIARNPVTELCALVSKCVDAKTGNLLIPGIEKTFSPPSKEEIGHYLSSGFSVDYFKSAHGLQKLRSEDPQTVMANIWGKPTFEVHGIAGGYQGEGIKTVVPPYAQAKVSLRLVPPQTTQGVFEIVKTFVQKENPDVMVEMESALEPYSTKLSDPILPLIFDAYEFGFGARPAVVREGGSIGAVVTMNNIWKTPVFFMGLSLPEDGYHGPDESFAWKQIEGGVKSFVKFFELFSKQK